MMVIEEIKKQIKGFKGVVFDDDQQNFILTYEKISINIPYYEIKTSEVIGDYLNIVHSSEMTFSIDLILKEVHII